MNRRRATVLGAALLVLAGIGRSALPARAAENMDILQKVQSAKTPADHEAIAAYYDQQAAAAKKQADEHRKMAATYSAGGTSIGKGSGPFALPQHCQALAKSFDQEASEYTAMAAAHRELAKSTK